MINSQYSLVLPMHSHNPLSIQTLGVSRLKSPEKIRKAVVRRALEVHDLMLKCYYPNRDWVNLALVKARATSLPSSSQSVFVHFLAPP